jgi:hypothetical protein
MRLKTLNLSLFFVNAISFYLLLGPSPTIKSNNLSKNVLFGLIIGLGRRVLTCAEAAKPDGGAARLAEVGGCSFCAG